MSDASSSKPAGRRSSTAGPSKPRRKRGTACDTCKIRKLRCSGPTDARRTCAECVKSGRKCVYSVVKSEEEVNALEARVAELESLLAVKPANQQSEPTVEGTHAAAGLATQPGTPAAIPVEPSSSSVDSTSWNPEQALFSPSAQQLEPELDLDTLLGFTTGAFDQAFSHPLDQSFVPFGGPSPSIELPSPSGTSGLQGGLSPAPNLLDAQTASSSTTPFSTGGAQTGQAGLQQQAHAQAMLFQSAWQESSRLRSIAIADVAPLVRDHLLDLFATRRRQLGLNLVGSRFREALTGPKADRPRSALFFAICTTSCRLSPVSAIRSLEEVFLAVTRTKINEGIANFDRLVQLIQASVILGLYFTSMGRQSEAWIQAGISTRLAVNSGLHRTRPHLSPQADRASQEGSSLRISSLNIFNSLKRTRAVILPPPKDALELGERIATFWATYYVDRWGSIVMGWAPTLSDVEIEIPFPRPLADFETGNPFDGAPIQTLNDLWREAPSAALERPSEDCLPTLISKVISLMSRASRLFDYIAVPAKKDLSISRPPSRSASSSRLAQLGQHDAPFAPTSTLEASPFPTELVLMRSALERFVYNLPLAFQEPLRLVEGGIPFTDKLSGGLSQPQRNADGDSQAQGLSAGVIFLHTAIYATYELLCDEESVYNAHALSGSVVAARCVATLIRRINDIDFGQLDLHLAPLWTLTSRTLLKEITRLKRLGDFGSITDLEGDVETIHMASQKLGDAFRFGTTQADLIRKLADVSIRAG